MLDERNVSTERSEATWRWIERGLLLLILLTALGLRTYRLDQVPGGVDYDESGNFILAQEIADGKSFPIFVRAYAGREGVFYWLAALSMRLLGHTLFAFRLTSALCGVGAIVLAFGLARDMFADEPLWVRRGTPLLAAVLMAVSYWLVHVNRYGFRANTMPLLMTAAMWGLWRGLRRSSWPALIGGGLLCGLSANTYLAVRAWPLVLAGFAAWTVLADRSAEQGRWLRLRQWVCFGLCALITLAPLAWFFWQNPEFFSVRMSQASIFDPEIHGGDLRGTLERVTLKMLGVFTVCGDEDPIYNLPGKPIFGPLIGLFFYGGLLIGLARMGALIIRRRPLAGLTPYVLIGLWLPIMMLPNILGARGVPHSLRSLGMLPMVFYLPALGLTWSLEWLASRWRFWRVRQMAVACAVLLMILAVGAAQTARLFFGVWAVSEGAYYRGSASLRRAAEYLGQWNPAQVDLWVSNSTYRHTTYAAMSPHYAHLRWFSSQTLVLPAVEPVETNPAPNNSPSLYLFDFTNPLDPALARFLSAATLQHRDIGPDGGVGFEAYLLPADAHPVIQPQHPLNIHLGHTLTLLGYDLNTEAVSGQMLDVTLYWQVLNPVDRDDWAFFVHLVDRQGFYWGGETFFHYPSGQWQPGQVLIFHKQLAIVAGAPPGDYELDLGVFSASLDARMPVLDAQGKLSGTSARAGPIRLVRAAAPLADLPPMQRTLRQEMGSGIVLLGFDLERAQLRPGETLKLSLYWHKSSDQVANRSLMIGLYGESGDLLSLYQGDPVQGQYPFAQWQVGEWLRDRYALRLPTDLSPDRYRLRVALACADVSADLGQIEVQAADRLWEAPPLAHQVGAQWANRVQLLGYSLDRYTVATGERIHLTLVWQCLGEMDVAYTVFTHLLDGAEQVRGQKDNPPQNGRYPTTLWVAGEVVIDEYDIPIQPDAPPGQYVIEVGLYNPANLERLPVFDPTGAVGDRVLLGEVRIVNGE